MFRGEFLVGYATLTQGVLNSMVLGAVLGTGYSFIYDHAQKASEGSHNPVYHGVI